MDPILQQLLAADPALGQAPVPSVTRGEGLGMPAPEAAPPIPPTQPLPSEFAADPLVSGQGPASGTGQAPPELNLPPGGSVSRSAVNFDTLNRLERRPGPAGGLTQRAEDTRDWRMAQAEELGARQKAINAKTGELEAQKAEEVAELTKIQARRTQKVALEIQGIQDQAWQKVNQAQADYQQQLAVMRAAKIEPHRFFDDKNLNSVQNALRGSSRASAYYMIASGKPALQQVGNAMLDNLDKEVDRNINAQVENMKNGQKVSDGFQAAWQLASQNAVSEEQARLRVKGMILQSIKDAETAEVAAKYDSDLIRAGVEQGNVKIDEMIWQTAVDHDKAVQKAAEAEAELKTRLATTAMQVAVERDQLAWDKEKEKNKKGSLEDMGIFPVADPETGKYVYSAKNKEAQEKMDDLGIASANFQDTMSKLDAAIRKAGGARIVGGAQNLAALKSSSDKEIASLATSASFLLGRIMDPNSRLSDKDRSAAADTIGMAGIFSRSDGQEARKSVRDFTLGYTQNAYRQLGVDLNPEVLEKLGHPTQGAQRKVQQGAAADIGSKPPEETPTDKAAAATEKAGAKSAEWKDLEEADGAWSRYVTTQGVDKYTLKNRQGLHPTTPAIVQMDSKIKEPGWAKPMSDLAFQMKDPKLDQSTRVQARTKLQAIVKDADNLDRAYYAKYLLGQE